mgnify:CR=1 FL=1
MTKMPSEADSPATLLSDLVALRDEALKQGDFLYAVHLSHCHAWLHWLGENFEELKNDILRHAPRGI